MASYRSISGELTQKIIVAIAILVLGGILGIILFSSRVVLEATNKNAQSTIDTYVENVEGIVQEAQTMESFIKWQMNDQVKDVKFVKELTEKLVTYNKMASDVTIAFAEDYFGAGTGYVGIQSSGSPENGDVTSERISGYSAESWFNQVKNQEKGAWSEPYTLTDDVNDAVVTYSVPMKNSSGEVYAVLAIDISCSEITKLLFKTHYYEDSYAVIVSDKGTFISHPKPVLMLKNISYFATKYEDKKFGEQVEDMISGGRGIAQLKSQKAVAIYAPVSNGWSAAIIAPAKELFGGVLKFQMMLLLIALADLIVLYFVTKTIISRTLLPITEVTYLARNIAKGNFKATIPKVEGTTEMFHLHEALRNMLHSINDYIAQLKDTTAVKDRIKSELDIASHIQQQMLRTDFINDDEVDLFATLTPAKEVGGDMYDFLRTDRTIYFAVGDVSGKGVPAALYMAISRSLFHYVSEMSLSANNIVACINSSFCSGNETNMFITMFVGRLDLDTREMVFCNAGHNPIIIISPEGKARYIHARPNLAAGVFDSFDYQKESFTVERGSRLLIYTDGVTEAENAAKAQYGEDRLIAFANSMSPDTPSEVFVEKLIADVKAFTNGNDQNDDITIMSIRV